MVVYSANIDEIDHRIISELQRNGRLSNVELAERVGLSASPCLRRVKRLEAHGVIKGYAAQIDREAYGLTLTVFVEIIVSRHSRDNAAAIGTALADIPGLIACHMVSGNADFLIELAVTDLKAYEAILTEHILTLDAVSQVRSNVSLREVMTGRPLRRPRQGSHLQGEQIRPAGAAGPGTRTEAG